jgi:hypothetical protein
MRDGRIENPTCNYMNCQNDATTKGYIMPGLRPYRVYACDEHKTKPDFIEGEPDE